LAREAQDETLNSQKQQRRRLSLVRPSKSKLSLARAVQKQITISKKHQRRLSLGRAAKKETLEETPIGPSSEKRDIGGDSHWSEHAITKDADIGQSMQAQKDAPIGQRSIKGDIGGDSHWSEYASTKGCSPLVKEAQQETPMVKLIFVRCLI